MKKVRRYPWRYLRWWKPIFREHKCIEEADATTTAADCFLREQDLFALRAEDIAESNGEVALRLGVPERGESAKTGRHQGVVVDRPHVARLLLDRKSKCLPHEKVFKSNQDRYRQKLHDAEKRLGFTIGPAHSVRHSGPSHDCLTGYRSLSQVQTRGRWKSEKSVLRYAKPHTLIAVRARFSAETLAAGQQLLNQLQPRPAKAKH